MGLARMLGFYTEDDDMVRAKAVKASINHAKVDDYVARLRAAKTDRSAFDAVLKTLTTDADVAAADIAAIANSYGIGGAKAASRKAGIEKISKRFVELVRYDAKNKVAEKFRPI